MAKTTVTLAGKDTCLIIRESGTIEVVGPDTTPASDATTLLLAVADHVLTDPEFCEDMLDYMEPCDCPNCRGAVTARLN